MKHFTMLFLSLFLFTISKANETIFTCKPVYAAVQTENGTTYEETLEEIAQTTSGTYFRATDTAKLESIYEEINRMETTQITTTHFRNYREISIDF